jgi:carboxylate-amine ligase
MLHGFERGPSGEIARTMHKMTVGVEEELHVVEAGTGHLVPRGDDVLEAARPMLGQLVTRELNLCQVETASPICDTLAEVEEHLHASRSALLTAAAGEGLAVAAVGTHPFGRWQDQQIDRSRPRYRALEESYQALARQQIICGCHVHVGFEDRETLFGALRRVRPWLPMLLALSANSPFWQGEDTGYASYRTQVWQRWPTAGMPPELSCEGEYDAVVTDLMEARAMPDASYLYWDARPSTRYPTLEIRALDTCLLAADAVTLVGLIRGLLWRCAADAEAGIEPPPLRPEVLEAATWRASRYGVTDALVSPSAGELVPAAAAIDELLAYGRPGLEEHGDAEAIIDGVRQILLRGTGSALQLSAVAARGGDTAGVMAEIVAATGDTSGSDSCSAA